MIATPLSRHLRNCLLAAIPAACLLSTKADFPDPGHWKPLFPNPTPNYVNTAAYGNGTWVAAGDFGYLATSTDGLTWR